MLPKRSPALVSSTTWSCQAVSQCCLTSVFEWELVFPAWHGLLTKKIEIFLSINLSDLSFVSSCNDFVFSSSAIIKPPEADDWYKNALERARAIAQTMKAPPPAVPLPTTPEPSVSVKPEPKHQPESDDDGDKDEYGSGAPGPSSSSTNPSKCFFCYTVDPSLHTRKRNYPRGGGGGAQ